MALSINYLFQESKKGRIKRKKIYQRKTRTMRKLMNNQMNLMKMRVIMKMRMKQGIMKRKLKTKKMILVMMNLRLIWN